MKLKELACSQELLACDCKNKGFSEGGNWEVIVLFFKDCEGAIAKKNKHQFLFWINQLAYLSTVGDAIEDVADAFGLASAAGANEEVP